MTVDATFIWPVRVYYEDTDAGGVVYHTAYLRFMERARTEWLRSLGFGQEELRGQTGVVFVVRAIAIDYLRPARLDDALDVAVELARKGRASLVLNQAVSRLDGEQGRVVLSKGEVRIACVDPATGVPCPLPQEIKEAIARVS